ncbi:Zinc finger MYM-type protein 4 [Larimichthys crocea]|uniref:Uncharacterized protein n=1 Tax=Larimichthys crocea TaxID=215358 RepID=A0ACD3RGC2_LARCR|nr:Zinc finger MYM-type protein 4 [Larimichthys crocea]
MKRSSETSRGSTAETVTSAATDVRCCFAMSWNRSGVCTVPRVLTACAISRTLVTAKYKGTDEKFCSEDCNSKYKMLFCHIAKCDTCGHEGKLRQSLPLLGEVKHFCDLKCVLHFCNQKVQTVNADSSPPRSAGTTESSPVIANVISLAGALARQPSASVSSAEQTLCQCSNSPQELKNKSMLCTPLVHNKGVSCTPQTVDTEAQTDNFVPKVVVLPLPVPVYVPMPMNMYSQYTPKPVGLPLPLPVPVFLPGRSDGADPAKETTQPDPPEEELDSKSEDEESDKEDGHKDRAVTRRRQSKEHTSDRSDDSDVVQEDDSSSDSSFGSHGPRSVPGELPPPATPGLVMREDLQRSPSPAQASPLLQNKYLFENGRMENIFSDLIYNKFSAGFTEILKGFRPSVTASAMRDMIYDFIIIDTTFRHHQQLKN